MSADFFSRIDRILAADPRYREGVYDFVMDALERAVRERDQGPGHVGGQQLLRAIRREAEQQFGPMMVTVLRHWGIKNSLDFGHVVFNMVQEGILSKSENDSLDDFKDEAVFGDLLSGAEVPAKNLFKERK